MTISTETRKAGPFTCDGVAITFPFAFKVFSASDVRVVLLDDTNVETDLTLTTHYSVSLNADQDNSPGGTVTTVATYATGNYLTLSSKTAYTQSTKITNPGGFYPEVINDALDRATIQIQQVVEKVSRAALMPISGVGSMDPSSLFFGVNAAGDAAELKAITDLSPATPATPYMLSLLASSNASSARATLVAAQSGANTDITSLNAPSLGEATAVTPPTGDSSTKVSTTEFVSTAISDAVPAGTIIVFSGDTPPAGYLACPTSQTDISRTTYSRLFAAIGTVWGVGDGASTFGMPWVPADYALVQGGVVGSATVGENLAHTHPTDGMLTNSPGGHSWPAGGQAGSYVTGSSGGPANLAAGHRVKFCVKY